MYGHALNNVCLSGDAVRRGAPNSDIRWEKAGREGRDIVDGTPGAVRTSLMS